LFWIGSIHLKGRVPYSQGWISTKCPPEEHQGGREAVADVDVGGSGERRKTQGGERLKSRLLHEVEVERIQWDERKFHCPLESSPRHISGDMGEAVPDELRAFPAHGPETTFHHPLRLRHRGTERRGRGIGPELSGVSWCDQAQEGFSPLLVWSVFAFPVRGGRLCGSRDFHVLCLRFTSAIRRHPLPARVDIGAEPAQALQFQAICLADRFA